MDIVIQPLSIVSIFTLCFIIAAIIFAYYKKWMMTYAIIIVNFIVFIISLIFTNEIIGELAFKPIYLSVEYITQIYTLITSMFLHSTIDFFHIIFNMIMFILIAPSFEDRIGAKRFILIYIITGICAAISHALLAPLINSQSFNPNIGLIGASGAISGILGAYAFSYPKDRVYFPIFILIRMPVIYAGVIFLTIQSFYIFIGSDSHIAYLAHVGGFISGVIIAAIFLRGSERVTKEGHVVYDSIASQKPSKQDFSELRKLATTSKLKEMLKKIEIETVTQVRDVWLEHFLEKTVCPKCKNPLNNLDGKVWCDQCGFRTNY